MLTFLVILMVAVVVLLLAIFGQLNDRRVEQLQQQAIWPVAAPKAPYFRRYDIEAVTNKAESDLLWELMRRHEFDDERSQYFYDAVLRVVDAPPQGVIIFIEGMQVGRLGAQGARDVRATLAKAGFYGQGEYEVGVQIHFKSNNVGPSLRVEMPKV